MEEPKEFEVDEVVTSELGVCRVTENARLGMLPVEVFFKNGAYAEYTADGRLSEESPISLFHGKGKVDITFTPDHEPVYEYQWLLKYKVGVVDTSAFYKTEGEMLDDYSDHEVEFFERLDKYRREAK